MSVRDELEKAPLEVKRNIARFARKLLKKQANIHTIIVEKKQGIERADKFTDFELLLFYNAECDIENKRIISESAYYGGSGKMSENCRIYSPGSAQQKNERVPLPDDPCALLYRIKELRKDESDYLGFLREHLNFFTINDYMDITTVNSPEMEKSNPLFCQLYTTYHFEKGYLIYNRLVKPFITLCTLPED